MRHQSINPNLAVQEEEGSGVAQVKTAFTVKLVKFEDSKKIQLIKELKNLMEGINLVQVTVPLPQVVRRNFGPSDSKLEALDELRLKAD